ncbi:MAG: lipid-A-disaccharide synthase [Pirellulaceae bacterium]|jgi:lipid-A-disaccharide synthase|nr:lipid-A-disaccharide synthase [Pirellulaceae bacterium]MDP6718071.1 lipid-A-disaccharide synthase [Pirellulaceae bacterium]
MRIFFSVGEPSGDLHGANLIRELRQRDSQIQCVGYGGPRMADAGCQLHEDLTRLAVMWLLRVLLNLHHFVSLLRSADRYFREAKPDAVVLIDYPGFNWWMARAAKKNGIPVFYYGVPQLWAWAEWRIKKMRRFVDHLLCKLPFEEKWYRDRGCDAIYVGHPFFDETSRHELDEHYLASLQLVETQPLVTILPGSRTQEVKGNLPSFLQTVAKVQRQVPNVRFVIAAFDGKQAAAARQLVIESGQLVEVFASKAPELIHAATCCLACSGSVSLELLAYEKPTVILYRVSPLALFAQSFFRKVQYITLVNLLACKNAFPDKVTTFDPDAPRAEDIPFPEYLTSADKSPEMAAHITSWLTDDQALSRRIGQLRELKARFAHRGASATAADYILGKLSGTQHDQPSHRSTRIDSPEVSAPHTEDRSHVTAKDRHF